MKALFLAALGFALAPGSLAQAQSVAGEWDATYNTPGGPRSFKIVFVVQGDSLKGTVKRAAGDSPLAGTIKGDVVQFTYTIEYNGNALDIGISAKVEGDTMTGRVNFGGAAEDEFSAQRVKRP